MPFSVTVKVGQVVEIGNEAAIKLERKTGQSVRMVIGTKHHVSINHTGIIPERFYTHETAREIIM